MDIKTIILDIEKELNEALIYDEEEFDNDEICIEFNSAFNCYLMFYKSTGEMDIFRQYEYEDLSSEYFDFSFNNSWNCSNAEEIKSYILHDEQLFIEEKMFFEFLKKYSNSYISNWDDNGLGCYGFTSKVGIHNMGYDIFVIKEFVNLAKRFDGEDHAHSFKSCVYDFLVSRYEDLCIKISEEQFIVNNDIRVIINGNRKNISKEYSYDQYVGKEYTLFNINNEIICIQSASFNICIELLNNFNLSSEYDLTYEKDKVILLSNYLTFEIKCFSGSFFQNIEEEYLLYALKNFQAFSSNKLGRLISEINTSDKIHSSNVIVYNEGYTDAKHLKKFWDIIKREPKFGGVNIEFYNLKNKDSIKGNKSLLQCCEHHSIAAQEKKHVFIADSDDVDINKEFMTDNHYKSWGNNVYSFVLPIPSYRSNYTGVCIEHLYTDSELKKTYKCEDGKSRRLFLGNEFDKYGRHLSEKKFCTSRNVCGEKSMRIIDGGNGEKVLNFDTNDNTNYALSKMQFSEYSSVNENTKTFESFKMIFDIINEIFFDSK